MCLFKFFSKPTMLGDELFSRKWCEILFENRNKDYGAYQLRAKAGRRLTLALGMVLVPVLLVTIPLIILLWTRPIVNVKKIDPMERITRFEGVKIKEARPLRRPEKIKPEMTEQKKPEEVKELPQKEHVATTLHEEELVDPKQIVDLPEDSLQTILKEQGLELAKSSEQTVGIIVDSIPIYPDGGIRGFMRWLHGEMVYPPDCIRRRVKGTVEVAFIVEPDGSASDLQVVKGADPGLNHEVLRVLGHMQRWRPAKRAGNPIRSQVTLPVVFDL